MSPAEVAAIREDIRHARESAVCRGLAALEKGAGHPHLHHLAREAALTDLMFGAAHATALEQRLVMAGAA